MKRIPYGTLMMSVLTVAIHFVPSLGTLLQFDRAAIAHGQVWRFFTGHLVHFNTDHLRWDLLAFSVLGIIAERISRRGFLLTLCGASALITLGVWAAQPQFMTYRGLSGIDSALYGFVVASVLAAGWRERHRLSLFTGAAALAGFAAKCLFELTTGNTVFVAAGDAFAPVPLAHLLGLAAGSAGQFVSARLSRLESCEVPTACSVPSNFKSSTSAE